MRGFLHIRQAALVLACVAGGTAIIAVPASAQGSYSPYNETPAAALARYVRALASDPKDFTSLIGAGRAALELGDTQAAAGFFARADDVNPKSPLPQAGMGAVQVAKGEPLGALPYFTRAQQLGAPVATIGCDRGLAYDLLGKQAEAQADYRAALGSPDSDEARRRLALSLAISGDRANALDTLAPLMAKGDADAARARAFVLALTGDANGAMAAVDAAMPGSWARVAPFLQRLPTLAAAQKAAAVNLGLFPDAPSAAYAYATPTTPTSSNPGTFGSVSTDRLSGVDALLAQPSAAAPAVPQPAPQPAWQAPAPRPAQVAYASLPRPAVVRQVASVQERKIWLQLASGANANALSGEFSRIEARNRDLFDGIHPFVADSGDRARLLIGPFRATEDAQTFADDLHTVGIDAFKWTNSPTDRIVPLASE